MFYLCSSLKDLDISNFNTNNVIDITYMFLGCSIELRKKICDKNIISSDRLYKASL